jgi:hypothetical protein
MSLDQINETWKSRVNKGAHGRTVTLTKKEQFAKVDWTFWKKIKEYAPGGCDTGQVNVTKSQVATLDLDEPKKIELFGPKSVRGDYVGVEIFVQCEPKGTDVTTNGVILHPPERPADPFLLNVNLNVNRIGGGKIG